MDLTDILEDFWNNLEDIEIYNEFSFQHELGIYLRSKLYDDYKVEFERNIKFFRDEECFQGSFKEFPELNEFEKREIDIVAYDLDKKIFHAIELKYPRNGQYPESMYSFIKDIRFMEQLKDLGFDSTYCITIVDKESKPFYEECRKNDGIYAYFRKGETISGKIPKPTGKKNTSVTIDGNYGIEWIDEGNWKRYFIKI